MEAKTWKGDHRGEVLGANRLNEVVEGIWEQTHQPGLQNESEGS